MKAHGFAMAARAVQAVGIAAVLIVVLVAWLVATALLAPTEQGDANVVRIPRRGDVAAVRLTDGRPVFVVHHQTGEISVLDGFSTHIPYGLYKTLAWCPESRIFSDLAHGARYDEWGVYQGGPAPTGMIAMRWQLGAGGRLQVEGLLGPVEAAGRADTEPVDLTACTFAMHEFGADARLAPAEAASRPEGAWVVVAGMLDARRQRLCGLAPGCPSPAPIIGLVPPPEMNPQFVESFAIPRLWLAQVNAGRLSHLTYIPDPDAR